jgi:hypothetical protein
VIVVDSASAMAEASRQALGRRARAVGSDNRRERAGRLDCFATDTSRLDELAPRFLGEPITQFELVDL